MSKLHFEDESKFVSFLKGKGFYVALGVCMIGAAVAAFSAANSGLTSLKQQSETPPIVAENPRPLVTDGGNEPDSRVSATQPGVPRERVPIPGTSLPSDSAKSSSAPGSSSSSARVSAPSSEISAVLNPQNASQPLSFMLPVSGEIIVPFSGQELVKNLTLNEWRTHNGIDIAAPVGTPVKAVADGTVREVRMDEMWGGIVEVEHPGGIKSIYCSLSDTIPIRAGDKVSIGDIVGSVAQTALSEVALPPHLHFEMKRGDAYLDPLVTMNKK